MIGSYPSFSSLVPTQKYYYQTGDEKYGWSEEYSFRAPPTPSPNAMTRVIAYGDMGFGQVDLSLEHWEQQPALKTISLVTKQIHNQEADLILHIGDIRWVWRRCVWDVGVAEVYLWVWV